MRDRVLIKVDPDIVYARMIRMTRDVERECVKAAGRLVYDDV